MLRTLSRIFHGAGWRRHAGLALVVALALPSIAAADVVTDWNVVVEAVAFRVGGGPPQPGSRIQAIAHLAIHDALNSIEPRYARYTGPGKAYPGASPDAAVAAAGRKALLDLLAPLPSSPPKQAAIDMIEAAYLATVGPAPYDAATQAGIAAGEAAAGAILALRIADGSDNPHRPYTRLPGPGVYQPTPNPEFPAVITPSFEGWAEVTPSVLNHSAQFEVEPGALFDLGGEAYARDYNEVKRVGDARVRGALPDSVESDIARFWPGGGANVNLIARLIASGRGLDRWEHARLFALLNLALADALIANQTWKYTYAFWRPVTAIRWPDDGNAATETDPVWRPFLVTPPYPDYPCALPAIAATGTQVLRYFFGTDDIMFTRTLVAPPVPLPAPLATLPAKTITRSFHSLSEATAEAQSARVYAGIHFREGCVAGGRQGTQIARYVLDHALLPMKAKQD
jgi:hypothetical protein